MAMIFVVVLAAIVASTLGQNTNLDISPPEVSFDCSTSKPQTIIRTNITGGFSEHTTWPWMALLGWRNKESIHWACGGVLINEQWVLSHSGCIFPIAFAMHRFVVRLGVYDPTDDSDGAVYQDFSVADIPFLPKFFNVHTGHSLVLLKLNSTVSFEKSINPVCLPWGVDSNKNMTGQKGLVVSYWNTSGSFNAMPKEKEVVVVPEHVCDPEFEQSFNYTFCVNILGEKVPSCTKDFAAPLVTVEAGERYVAAGILRYGYYCERKNFPLRNRYNDLRSPRHLAWIKNIAFSTP